MEMVNNNMLPTVTKGGKYNKTSQQLAVRRTGYAMRAARELGCSDAYIHQRLKAAGLSLHQVLGLSDKDD